ncbi:MAG: hypothetical protein IKW13_07220 [Thermoguttaceae bacterium]|nr:hypothetical protein [Thermoguttaceae bacterium]
MLKPSRLTSDKSTRYNLPPSVVKTTRRAVAFGSLFLLFSDAAFSADAANVSRQPAVLNSPSTSTTQLTLNGRLARPEQSTQTPASELAQLEFRFQEAQKIGSERLAELAPQIVELLDAARLFATQAETVADAQLAERARTLVSQLVEFQRFISATSVFFHRLAKLDAASLNEKETRDFFASFLLQRDFSNSATPYYSKVSSSSNSPNATFAAYRAEFNRVAASFDALQTLERWNAFVETNGSGLERFYVAPNDAENALSFISQVSQRQGLPTEFKILERRAAEWRFTSLNRVAIQRKIILALESELTAKYWTFAAAPDQIYYLPQPPRSGRNVCFADAQGARSYVDIPANAPETASTDSTQRLFLQSLANEARSIPETLRADDPARWYAAWSAVLLRLQTTEELDPLVKFRLLQSVAQTLSDGDYYFAQRLAPTLRMLNVPRLSSIDALDVFQSESVSLQELRSLARSRIAFLPADRLTVDKTTEELDAQTERFTFVYRRVGWLDRDFSGAWRCRRPENAPLPVGDLYVLLVDVNDATGDKPTTSNVDLHNDAQRLEQTPRLRWLKIGSSDGRQTTLKFATSNVCRGSIVLCRSRVGAAEPVAEIGELERLLRR